MHLSSRQIGAASPTSVLAGLQSLPELNALLLPAAPQRRDIAFDAPIGPQGEWLLESLKSLRTLLYVDPQLAIVAAVGGEAWRTPLEGVAASLVEAQLGGLAVGHVWGDRLEERIQSLLLEGIPLAHAQTGDSLAKLPHPVVSAGVALGAAPYVHAMAEGCRFVLGGKASPGALAMGTLFDRLVIDRSDWNALATAMLQGAIAEALSLDLAITDEGSLFLLPGSVDSRECLEQRVHRGLAELGAPPDRSTLSLPEVTIDWRVMHLEWQRHGELRLTGIKGAPPTAEAPVEVIYALGVKTTLVAHVRGAEGPRRAADLAAQVESQFPFTSDSFTVRGASASVEQGGAKQPERIQLSVRLHGGDSGEVTTLYREVYNFVASQREVVIETPLLPGVSSHYEVWPTSLPRDVIEWDVEIRAASDWL